MTPAHHDLTLLTTERATWATCSCGWQGKDWRSKMSAQLEFGAHLVAARKEEAT
jgi:hypothetical protein